MASEVFVHSLVFCWHYLYIEWLENWKSSIIHISAKNTPFSFLQTSKWGIFLWIECFQERNLFHFKNWQSYNLQQFYYLKLKKPEIPIGTMIISKKCTIHWLRGTTIPKNSMIIFYNACCHDLIIRALIMRTHPMQHR